MDNINFICIRCNKGFKSNKYNFRKHFTKKKLCNVNNLDIDIDVILNEIDNDNYNNFYKSYKNKKQCEYCKQMMNKYNIQKHYKICKNNPINDNQISKDIYKNNQQITYNITNHNHITNIDNSINNCVLKINNQGEEDVSKIDYSKLDIIESGILYNQLSIEKRGDNHCNNIKKLFKDVYSLPENQNFKLLNKKEKSYGIKKDNTIEILDLKDLIININEILVNIYENYLEENKEELQHYVNHLKKQEKFLEMYKNNKNDETLKEYNKINNKIQKCLKNSIIFLAQKNKKNELIEQET